MEKLSFMQDMVPVLTAAVTALGGYAVAKINGKKDKEVFLNEQMYSLIEENKKERKELRDEIKSLAETNDALRLDIIALKENNGLLRNEVAKLTKENGKLRLDVIRLKDELSKRSNN